MSRQDIIRNGKEIYAMFKSKDEAEKEEAIWKTFWQDFPTDEGANDDREKVRRENAKRFSGMETPEDAFNRLWDGITVCGDDSEEHF